MISQKSSIRGIFIQQCEIKNNKSKPKILKRVGNRKCRVAIKEVDINVNALQYERVFCTKSTDFNKKGRSVNHGYDDCKWQHGMLQQVLIVKRRVCIKHTLH